MNYKILLLITSLIINNLYCIPQIKGFIDSKHNRLPIYNIVYLGKQVNSDHDGFFSMYANDTQPFNILICRHFETAIEKKNTVRKLKFNYLKPYKFFKATNNGWKVTNLYNEEIPDHTLIVRMNPKLVKTLLPWQVSITDSPFTMPRIVLKDQITKNALEKSSGKSLLYGLDQKTFHVDVKNETMRFIDDKKKIVVAK